MSLRHGIDEMPTGTIANVVTVRRVQSAKNGEHATCAEFCC